MIDVLKALHARHSVRAFLDKPVSQQAVTDILEAARFSPSGANIQPWHVAVVQGQTLQALSSALLEARANQSPEQPDYQYYPTQWFEPFKTRRVVCGQALYGALNIDRKDTDKRVAQWNRNYEFFGAPVGLVVMINKGLETGSWMDLGMFIQSILLAAEAKGLGTCAQASIAEHPEIIRQVLNINEPWSVACGIALGYEDKSQAVNQYRTGREAVNEFTRWYD